MAYDKKNSPNAQVNPAPTRPQAQLDSGDLAVLAAGMFATGVLTGGEVAATPAMLAVDVDAGTVVIQGVQVPFLASPALPVGPANASQPRFALIHVDAFGVVAMTLGPPGVGSIADYPALPQDADGNLTVAVLAACYIAKAVTVLAADAVDDMRVFVSPAIGGGVQALYQLNDVDVDENLLAGGEALVWDDGSNKWVAGSPSGGGGSALSVQENDVEIDAAVTALDFNGTDFDLTQSPAHEINIALSADVARDADVATEAAALAAADAAHVAAGDPHPQYLTVAEGDAAYDAIGAAAAAIVSGTNAEFIRDTIGTALAAGALVTVTVNDPGDTITVAIDTTALDERVRDTMGTALVAGTGITITPNDPGDTITISGTGTGYTDEDARDAIGAALVAGSLVVITVNDPGNTITVDVDTTALDERIRDTMGTALVAGTGVSIVVNDPGDTITFSTTITQYTDEMARDAIGTALVGDPDTIVVTPDDPGDTIGIAAADPFHLGRPTGTGGTVEALTTHADSQHSTAELLLESTDDVGDQQATIHAATEADSNLGNAVASLNLAGGGGSIGLLSTSAALSFLMQPSGVVGTILALYQGATRAMYLDIAPTTLYLKGDENSLTNGGADYIEVEDKDGNELFVVTNAGGVEVHDPIVMNGEQITGLADPTLAEDAATKNYVDSLAINIGKRARARAVTTANITIATGLNNGDSLDGVTLATGDLVLVKNQTAPAENGVYVVGVSPARSAEFDTYNEHPGSLIAVEEGSTNADTLWLCTSNDGGTLNTTAIAFSKMVVAGELLAANNLSDVANAGTSRTNLGLGTGDSPQFTAVEVGNVSDTTLARLSAGDLSVEGNRIFRVGGTDVPVADGGTGASSLTAHGVLLGEGTSAIVAAAAMTDGQLLVGQSAADPVPATMSGDATLAASGALTLAASGVSAASYGDASHTPTFTVDAKGRLTVASQVVTVPVTDPTIAIIQRQYFK